MINMDLGNGYLILFIFILLDIALVIHYLYLMIKYIIKKQFNWVNVLLSIGTMFWFVLFPVYLSDGNDLFFTNISILINIVVLLNLFLSIVAYVYRRKKRIKSVFLLKYIIIGAIPALLFTTLRF